MTRKTPEERRAELLARKQKLEAQLKKLDARDVSKKRKADARRKIIVGAICLHHAEVKPDFRKWLIGELKSSLTRQQDIDLFADLFSEK